MGDKDLYALQCTINNYISDILTDMDNASIDILISIKEINTDRVANFNSTYSIC